MEGILVVPNVVVPSVDTAEPPVVTATEQADPPETQQPETAPDQSPALDPAALVPETETGQGEPEKETPAEPEGDTPAPAPEPVDLDAILEGLDDDTLGKVRSVRSLLARREERTRRVTEAETADSRVHSLLTGKTAADLANAFTIGPDGAIVQDTAAVDRGVMNLYDGSIQYVAQVAADAVDSLLPDGFAITKEQSKPLVKAAEDFKVDPRGKNKDDEGYFGLYVKEWVTVAVTAKLAEKEADLRKEIEAELRPQFEARATAADRAHADTVNGLTDGGPTRGVPGAAAGSWTSQAQIEAAHVSGKITTEEVRVLHSNGTYFGLPED